jgi:hypothetical protein
MNEVEAVARAIAPSRWEVMDHYLAQTKRKYAGENAAYDPDNFKDKESMATALAAIAALDAARGDQVARVVAYLRQVSIAEDKRAEGNEGTIYGQCVAYISLALRRAADAIERGEPFNG